MARSEDGDITVRTVARDERPEEELTVRVLFEGERGVVHRPPLPLGDAPLAVGRQVAEGIALRDPRASRRHAVLTKVRGRAIVEDFSSNGTFVNGHRIEGETPLVDGDVVRLGDSFLLVRVTPTVGEDADIPSLFGRHPAMRELRRTIEAVAPTDAKVLVVGESGTGKELVARAIHERSGREGPFVAVNCGAIAESLAESQLFGHAAGAFTGAQGAHPGLVRAAHGGTLFLDEIGELSPVLQPKLLRALEERKVVPVGRVEPIDVDVRLIAATHRDLLRDVDEGRFRGDLYARVAGYVIHTLPLRDRREDLLPLLARFLGEEAPPLAPDLVEALLLHPFRFNVRELKELATQLRIDGAGRTELSLALVERRLGQTGVPAPAALERPAPPPVRPREPPPSREVVEALLREHGGNISQVARALGRSRRQVYRYLESWGVPTDERPD
jgi:DNA-binding NtrC family response regulator